jgi:hypothetical protein
VNSKSVKNRELISCDIEKRDSKAVEQWGSEAVDEGVSEALGDWSIDSI